MWKIKVRHFFYSLPFFAVSPFIFSSGAVFASSQTINPVVSSTPQSIDFTQFSFSPNYVVFYFDYTNATTFQQINSSIGVSTNVYDNPFNPSFNETFCQLVLRRTYKPSSLICMVDPSIATVYRISPVFSDQFSVVVSMTFYDVLPGESVSCPPIPDNPYDDKLDSINRSILIVSATALVIYFFYAIYSMFFGGIR